MADCVANLEHLSRSHRRYGGGVNIAVVFFFCNARQPREMLISSTKLYPKVCGTLQWNMYDRLFLDCRVRFLHISMCAAHISCPWRAQAFPIKMQIKYFTRDLALLCTIDYCCKNYYGEIAFFRVPGMYAEPGSSGASAGGIIDAMIAFTLCFRSGQTQKPPRCRRRRRRPRYFIDTRALTNRFSAKTRCLRECSISRTRSGVGVLGVLLVRQRM